MALAKMHHHRSSNRSLPRKMSRDRLIHADHLKNNSKKCLTKRYSKKDGSVSLSCSSPTSSNYSLSSPNSSSSRNNSSSSNSTSDASSEKCSDDDATKNLSTKELRALRDVIIEEKFGYTDEVNPFGDPNLSKPLRWSKKEELARAKGISAKKLKKVAYLTQTASKIKEIEQVRNQREQREQEQKLLEEQQAALARERELENYELWAEKEEAFHRFTAHKRSEIRLEENRPKNIDFFVKMLQLIDGKEYEDLKLPSTPPHEFFKTLSKEDMEALLIDIQEFTDLSSSTETIQDPKLQQRRDFWNSLLLLAKNVLLEEEKSKTNETTASRDMTTGLATAALNELRNLLVQKTQAELQSMESAITQKLRALNRNITSQEDPAYWETVSEMLPYYKAVATCREVYNKALDKSYQIEITRRRSKAAEIAVVLEHRTMEQPIETHSVEEKEENTLTEKTQANPLTSLSSGESNTQIAPVVITKKSSNLLNESIPLLTIDEFNKQREELKKKLIENRFELVSKFLSEQEKKAQPKTAFKTQNSESAFARSFFEQFVRQEQLTMEEDEFVMTPAYEILLPLTQNLATNNDFEFKYRPRKPRYFNRVRTGYEWSKYNQTHYDRDNPPPKIVQGYKFNIFYSDLVDRSVPPTWKISASDSQDTVIITFKAGPPYEDIKFRIVNREWDLHPRSGFRNTFDRGVLQLHFNFKRYRYRR